jgi:hypothetical protein
MTKKVMCTLMFVVLGAAGCGGDDEARRAQKGAYEVVQEGAASGVTSTIQGPGETLPPVTATNVDTTTAFTIDPNAAASAPPPMGGTLAGTLPPAAQAPAYPQSAQSPMTSSAQPRTVYVPSQPPPQRPPMQTTRPEQPAEPAPSTDTAEETEPATNTPPPTATAPPTTTAPPPEPKPAEEEEEEEEPPPPPTTTDTRGQ